MFDTDSTTLAESRFALDRPRGALIPSDAPPSPLGVRPFGLRFARPFAASLNPIAAVPAYEYCPTRQIAVITDDQMVPLFKHTNPHTVESTGTPDGGKPGGEETRSDWQNG